MEKWKQHARACWLSRKSKEHRVIKLKSYSIQFKQKVILISDYQNNIHKVLKCQREFM